MVEEQYYDFDKGYPNKHNSHRVVGYIDKQDTDHNGEMHDSRSKGFKH